MKIKFAIPLGAIVLILGLYTYSMVDISFNSNKIVNSESLYVNDITSVHDVIQYSSNVVKATLKSVEDFDGRVSIYLFSVNEDYTNNTPTEFHMYDTYNDNYVIGHSYYLFLYSKENALYPHTIYTSTIKDLIIDTTSTEVSTTSINDHRISLSSREVEDICADEEFESIVGKKSNVNQQLRVTENDNLNTVSETADIIAKVRISDETVFNQYASIYSVELLDTISGPSTGISKQMALSPGLETNCEYYLYLKEDPTNPGNYVLFSRNFSIVPVQASDKGTVHPS